MVRGKIVKIGLAAVVVIAFLLGGLYAFIVWEGSSTRPNAPVLEARIAQWLLYHTVPADYRAMKNPLDSKPGSPDVSAGNEIYNNKCALCHAFDGSSKTDIAAGQYPRPPDLRGSDTQRMSDGE